MASAIRNSKYTSAPYPGFVGCLTINAKAVHLEYVWAALLVYDALSLVFVVIPGLQLYRHGIMGHSRLSNVVFRDGVIYYITLFIFSLLNIIFTVSLPVATRSSLATMGRTLHSTLASRVLLHMRDTVSRRDEVGADRNHGRGPNVHITRTTHHDHLEADDAQAFTQTTTYGSDILAKD
ncbi:hypothetical protein JR316_0010204 [Psilocybe cubensis]|nr:hypothetical protein JR316_0010204 [Psilocybe cubensis]KAH9477971.1 hypothetical protein JR316_0010204 [Psilocybe cubensis]